VPASVVGAAIGDDVVRCTAAAGHRARLKDACGCGPGAADLAGHAANGAAPAPIGRRPSMDGVVAATGGHLATGGTPDAIAVDDLVGRALLAGPAPGRHPARHGGLGHRANVPAPAPELSGRDRAGDDRTGGDRAGRDGAGGDGAGGDGAGRDRAGVGGVVSPARLRGDQVEAGIVALWRRYGYGRDPDLRDRLVLHYAPLVKYVAGRVGTGLPPHVDASDLVQSGIFGLVDAIERFEPERGLKFETYAMQRIRGAILDDLRAQDWVPRSVRSRAREVERALERLAARLQRSATDAEVAAELDIGVEDLRDLYAQLQLTSVVALDELVAAGRGNASLAETLPDYRAEDPVRTMEDREARRSLAHAISQLAERDRVVVTLYYFENLTLAEIGRVLGVTESRVCQLHTRAVLRLRAKLLETSPA
jgi:RNA polymerase sigma factor for flagellar operon FliA